MSFRLNNNKMRNSESGDLSQVGCALPLTVT